MSSEKKPLTYKDSGVDIDAGNRFVKEIGRMVRSTFTPGVLSEIGGFGGLFKADFGSMQDPVLVSSVDGVGTKLMVAFKTGRHDTVGEDLVNHCVNDIAVCGATPLFFLDYFSTGRLQPHVGRDVVSGFVKACRENNTALIGGETAEMPDLYSAGEYDLAGTVVGVVDRPRIVSGDQVRSGDLLIGVPSSGLHTNGYSLARKVLFSTFDVNDHVEELGGTVGSELLKVHRSYLALIQRLHGEGLATGFSHITGGGIEGNTSRILRQEGLRLRIDWEAWDRPAIFDLIQRLGSVPEADMRQTFNLGVGLVVACRASDSDRVRRIISEFGDAPIAVGEVV